MNRGIFMTPGREEEWTLSVTHDDEAVDAYVQVFEAMADDLSELDRELGTSARVATAYGEP